MAGRILGIAGLALAVMAGAAWADAVVEEVRVVGQRSLAPEFESVGNFSRLDEATVRRTAAVHAHEAMVRVPGVWISRGSEQEHLTAVRSAVLSGPGACGAFLLQENGVPIRPAGFCNVNNLFELNVEQAAAVEVIRGPASALYGGNALHGVINVVAPAAEPDLPQRVILEAGPWNYFRGVLDVSAETRAGRVRALLQATDSGGWRDDTGHDQQKLNLAWDTTFGDWQASTLVSATRLDQDTGGFVLGEDAYKDPVLRKTNPNPEAYRKAWALRASSELLRPLNDGAALVLTPYVRASEMEFLQHFLPGQPLEENGQWSAGVIGRWRNPGEVLSWTVGAHLEYADTWLEQTQDGPTVGTPFLEATRPAGVHYDYDVASVLAAGFYDLVWHVHPQVDLVHSLRLETVRYDYTNQTLTGNTRDDGTACGFGGCLYSRPADRKDRFTDLAARMGAEYRPRENLRLWLTGGIGFRAPQTTELYRLQSGQQVTDLNSESLRSLELGFVTRRADILLGVTGFVERKEDEVLRDANGFNISAGKTRAEGLEFDVSWAPGEVHSLSLAATWARHRYDFSRQIGGETITAGDDVDTAPRWHGSAQWAWTPREDFSSELEAVYLGRYYVNAENTETYPGHLLFNLRAAWQFRPNARLSLRLLNLADKKHADRADFAFGNFRYFPGQPRRAHVTLEVEI
ncbi:MAG: TonB-dependent receptor [Gammaproteobacteria bacterium]|nr:TonB-dependent receptor [Gammaproteobacteria bacterium]